MTTDEPNRMQYSNANCRIRLRIFAILSLILVPYVSAGCKNGVSPDTPSDNKVVASNDTSDLLRRITDSTAIEVTVWYPKKFDCRLTKNGRQQLSKVVSSLQSYDITRKHDMIGFIDIFSNDSNKTTLLLMDISKSECVLSDDTKHWRISLELIWALETHSTNRASTNKDQQGQA